MNKLLILISCLLALSVSGQKYDTIYVSNENTSYLLFDEPILLFNIGSTDYIGQADDPRMLFLKATKAYAKTTTLVVSYGEKLFTGFLTYRNNPHPFYDYRKPEKENKLPNSIENKLRSISELPSNISYKSEKQNVQVALENLYNDTQATYLKFTLKNNSSIVYDLDYVSFSYVGKKGKRNKKSNSLQAGLEEMNPLAFEQVAQTKAGERNSFLYAIPLYSTTEKGYLQIIFREKAGMRSISLQVPFANILNATLF